MENTYIGSRYVPQIEGLWSIAKEYENFSIVVDENNNSFTSRKYVPVGIELNNLEYWVQTGNFNAQIEQKLKNLDDRIKALENKGVI